MNDNSSTPMAVSTQLENGRGLGSGLFSHAQAACITIVFLSIFLPISSRAWVPCFRNFVGVNDSGTNNMLFTNSISFMRTPIYWDTLASSSNVWNAGVLTNWGTQVLGFQGENVQFLPILCYTAQWAADNSARSWTNGTTIYRVIPHTYDTNMDYYVYTNGVLKSQSVLSDLTKFPAANVNDWSNYVYRVASFLHAPPYNVQYFQIWNEAYYGNGFWYGGLNEYIQKVHLPAAQAIHAAGGQVVYGGWPDVALPGGLLNLLTANNAWGSIDVLDMHYFQVGDVQTLRAGADAQGYTNMAIWQTEIGFTSDYVYSANYYPRALFWSLTNNWAQDKYRAFYFANQSGTSSGDYGYNDDLWLGTTLNGSGIVLTNLAAVLGGTNQLIQFTGVTSSPALFLQPWTGLSSMESFAYSTNIAVVVHLTRSDYANNPTVTLYLPVAPGTIAKAARVDLSGTVSNLTGQITANGAGAQLTVPTADIPGSPSSTWNAASSCPTFYVLVNISSTNLAWGQPVVASSVQSASYSASNAVDGNLSTRWSSAFSDAQWIYVDLGATYNISRVTLNWEAAYGKSYQIQVSSDATNWTTIFSTNNGVGGTDDLAGLSGTGRYVKMNGIQRGTSYGYSLYEFQVYGTAVVPVPTGLTATAAGAQVSLGWNVSSNATSYNIKRSASIGGTFAMLANVTTTNYVDTTGASGTVYYYAISALMSQSEGQNSSPVSIAFPMNLALNQGAYASSTESGAYPASNAVDGNLSTEWLSQYSDPQWIYLDLGTNYNVSSVVLNWGATAAKAYQINISTNAVNWVTVYSTNNANGGTVRINFTPTLGRYVRMYGIQRLTTSGYALNEFQVFGMPQTFALGLAQTAGLLTLAWPADGSFALWSTTNLTSQGSWFPVTNLLQGTNTLTVTVTPLGQNQFFQLRSN